MDRQGKEALSEKVASTDGGEKMTTGDACPHPRAVRRVEFNARRRSANARPYVRGKPRGYPFRRLVSDNRQPNQFRFYERLNSVRQTRRGEKSSPEPRPMYPPSDEAMTAMRWFLTWLGQRGGIRAFSKSVAMEKPLRFSLITEIDEPQDLLVSDGLSARMSDANAKRKPATRDGRRAQARRPLGWP